MTKINLKQKIAELNKEQKAKKASDRKLYINFVQKKFPTSANFIVSFDKITDSEMRRSWESFFKAAQNLNYPHLNEYIKDNGLSISAPSIDKIKLFILKTDELLKIQFIIEQNKFADQKLNQLISSSTLNKFAEDSKILLKGAIASDLLSFDSLCDQTKLTALYNARKDRMQSKDAPKPLPGYGAHKAGSYTEDLIKATATRVLATKNDQSGAGLYAACQEFAQVAFVNLKNYSANDLSIKLVSFDMGQSSHTFVLLGHDGKQTNGKIISEESMSNCIIVDFWAYAMGYTDTNGLFTVSNYPFPSMLENVKLLHHTNDKKTPAIHQNKKNSTPIVENPSNTQATKQADATIRQTNQQKNIHSSNNHVTFFNSRATEKSAQTQEAKSTITAIEAHEFILSCYNSLSKPSLEGSKGALICEILTKLKEYENNDANHKDIDDLTVKAINIFLTRHNKITYDKKTKKYTIEEHTPYETKSSVKVRELLNKQDSKISALISKKTDLTKPTGNAIKLFDWLKNTLLKIFDTKDKKQVVTMDTYIVPKAPQKSKSIRLA